MKPKDEIAITQERVRKERRERRKKDRKNDA